MRSKTEEENREDILSSMTNEGRMYGVFEDGTLAAVAGTSAENSMSAMIVSVRHPAGKPFMPGLSGGRHEIPLPLL